MAAHRFKRSGALTTVRDQRVMRSDRQRAYRPNLPDPVHGPSGPARRAPLAIASGRRSRSVRLVALPARSVLERFICSAVADAHGSLVPPRRECAPARQRLRRSRADGPHHKRMICVAGQDEFMDRPRAHSRRSGCANNFRLRRGRLAAGSSSVCLPLRGRSVRRGRQAKQWSGGRRAAWKAAVCLSARPREGLSP